MISKMAIEERVREWGIREDVVEKDHALGWVLWGIGSDSALSESWAFKGGTCLKKCYVETWRFSEDLDFTVLPGGPISRDDVLPIVEGILGRVHEESGIDFSKRAPLVKSVRPDYTDCRVYYTGPRGSRGVASIKIDLTSSEVVARPTVLRAISHAYPEELPGPGTARCYAFEEIFAEKIRAMGERGRPRDLYDIVHLHRRQDPSHDWRGVRDLLREKCSTKGIPVPTIEAIRSAASRPELASEWANMLAHQLPALPPFEESWKDVHSLFAWLDHGGVGGPLQPFLPTVPPEDELDPTWSPPPTMVTWGAGVPIEAVRFAAVNHLLVEVRCKDGLQTLEPYSVRRSKAGNLLLLGIRSEDREPRAIRVDQVRSVRVLDATFTPAYRVDVAAPGPVSEPPASPPG